MLDLLATAAEGGEEASKTAFYVAGIALTLEITNLTRVPIKLYAGLPIAQLSFMALDSPAERPYGSPELGSHYQGQVAATESRYMR